MEVSTTPILTPARIVALTLIVILIGSLAYLRFAPRAETVAVPAGGANAGEPLLERCHYTTEDGNYAAACGTPVVPENRAEPQSRLIALPVARIIGLAAAVDGALVGGWLGFHSTEGFVALITTIVGATIGANLLILALDMTSASQPTGRVVEGNRSERPVVLQAQEDLP